MSEFRDPLQMDALVGKRQSDKQIKFFFKGFKEYVEKPKIKLIKSFLFIFQEWFDNENDLEFWVNKTVEFRMILPDK